MDFLSLQISDEENVQLVKIQKTKTNKQSVSNLTVKCSCIARQIIPKINVLFSKQWQHNTGKRWVTKD